MRSTLTCKQNLKSKIVTILTLTVLLSICLFSCLEDEVERLNFPELKLKSPEFVPPNTVYLETEADISNEEIKGKGFYWSDNENDLISPDSTKIGFSTAIQLSDKNFYYELDTLPIEGTYYFMAFAEIKNPAVTKNRTIFSNIEPFSFNVNVELKDTAIVFNDTAVVRSEVSGVRINKTLVKYCGFIFSDDMTSVLEIDNLDSSTDTVLSRPIRHGDVEFESVLPDLSFNTCYKYKSWIITLSDTIYSDSSFFCIRGGWKCEAGQSFVSRLGGVVRGKAYYMKSPDISDGICEFRPDMHGEKGNWREDKFFLGPIEGTRTVSFAIDDALYFGFRDKKDSTRLKKLVPETANVVDINIANRMKICPGAVTFVIGGKVYFGWGKDAKGNYKLDFNFYDPKKDLIRNDFSIISDQPPVREDAVTFVIGNEAYIGMGMSKGKLLRDFWKFTPPDPDSTKVKAVWKKLPQATFPLPEGRLNPVFFVIGDKGYLGTGKNSDGDLFSDFWQFCPNNNSDPWTPVTDIPSPLLCHATGFAIDGIGYLGSGLDSNNLPNSNFWRYTPDSN